MMCARPITPPPRPGALVFGHFRRTGQFSGWRPTGTRDWLLIYTVTGGGRVEIDGTTHPLAPGRIVLFAPGTSQDYSIDPAVGRWELLWTHFLPPAEWNELLRWPELGPGVKSLSTGEPGRSNQVEMELRRAGELAARRLERRDALALNALQAALLWCELHNPNLEASRLDPRIRRALDDITADLRRPFALGRVARVAGLSVSQLIALFKKQVGQTPRQFWEHRRIEQARHLLERTQLSVAEVAEAVGYADPLYFSTRFKAVLRLSPRHYRGHHARTIRP